MDEKEKKGRNNVLPLKRLGLHTKTLHELLISVESEAICPLYSPRPCGRSSKENVNRCVSKTRGNQQ
jgi:hypothetical protein